ncbi:MAG: orotidine-5'-phosphate decarboxylase [Candidatus Norongarragalinales archaeon]
MNFADQLIKTVEKKNSRVCVGLDPVFEVLPSQFRSFPDKGKAVFEFNKRIIHEVKGHCVCVKPNLAFYLALGEGGWTALKKTVDCAKSEGLLVVLDAKANDIGNTAQAYADAFFDGLNADAVTINPFLGSDALLPFLKDCGRDKGVFVLVKTSNDSSSEFQGLKVSERKTLSEEIARKVVEWEEYGLGSEGYSSIGAVVGATFPEQAKKLRRIMKKQFFLVPGYGAQGASAKSVKNFFDDEGLGAIVNSSRGIIYASGGSDFAEAADKAAEKMKNEINEALGV